MIMLTPNKFQRNVPLAPLTTWKIGGPAKFFLAAKTPAEVKEGIAWAAQQAILFFILGGGSNLLISDNGFSGLVIKMEISEIFAKDSDIIVGAGASMGRTAAFAMQHNLSGLEWAVGLPGTVGGAIYGNSNCFGSSTGELLKSATVLDKEGKIRQVGRDYFKFSYDFSSIQNGEDTILEAVFGLKKVSEVKMQQLREQISKTAAERYAKQPLGQKCAGSVFKAIDPSPAILKRITEACNGEKIIFRDGKISAGFIIDKCLHRKGFRKNQMQISETHANFFINLGVATAENAASLIDFIKKECQNKLDIVLYEEIRYVGKFS